MPYSIECSWDIKKAAFLRLARLCHCTSQPITSRDWNIINIPLWDFLIWYQHIWYLQMFGVEKSGQCRQNSKYGKSERCHNNNFAGRAAALSLMEPAGPGLGPRARWCPCCTGWPLISYQISICICFHHLVSFKLFFITYIWCQIRILWDICKNQLLNSSKSCQMVR